MGKVYQLKLECGDPWARYDSVAVISKNKKQLEDLAKRMNKVDKELCARVSEVYILDTLTEKDIKELFRYYSLDLY